MKYFALLFFAALGLASCSDDEDTPTPERITRTIQTVTLTYARAGTAIDTVLQNPRMDVFVLQPTVNADGTLSYPSTTGATPVFSTTDFSNPQPVQLQTLSNQTVGSQPDAGIRVVFTTSNRPGRRTTPNPAQRLTASVITNGVSRVTFNHQGTNFSRTASPINGVFTTIGETNIAGFN